MTEERVIHGVVGSVGIAVGKAVRTFDPLFVSLNAKLRPDQLRKEVERFRGSVEKSREQLKRMQVELRRKSGPESSFLIDAHLLVLQDRLFVDRKSTTSELQSPMYLVCRLLLEKKKQ